MECKWTMTVYTEDTLFSDCEAFRWYENLTLNLEVLGTSAPHPKHDATNICSLNAVSANHHIMVLQPEFPD